MEFSLLQKILMWAIPVLFAITVHEASHAYVAYYYGDDTAKSKGRMSLNPVKHIELFGTILLPLLLLVLSGFKFTLGWAKPVPVLMHRLRNPFPNMALVAIAGPASNLLMALIWAMILKLLIIMSSEVTVTIALMVTMAKIGIFINLVLAILNLIPIPPLDGSRIIAWLIPLRSVDGYYKLEPFGIFILLALIIMGWLGQIILPPVKFASEIIYQLFGLI